MYNKRVWFSHAASHHRPHFPYSSPPSHHSHLTQYNPYFYLYLYIFPTQVHHIAPFSRHLTASHLLYHTGIPVFVFVLAFVHFHHKNPKSHCSSNKFPSQTSTFICTYRAPTFSSHLTSIFSLRGHTFIQMPFYSLCMNAE